MSSIWKIKTLTAVLLGLVLSARVAGQDAAPAVEATKSEAQAAVARAWAEAQREAIARTSHSTASVQQWTRGPGTLLQWSYGNSFSGGPNLDEPLVTDRPDFTEASSTVGNGVLQIEMGYTYTKDSVDDLRTHSWGEPLLRYGMLADWFELRLAVFPATRRAGGNTTRGVRDLYMGAKIGLTPQEGILPEMAIMPQANIPSGSNAFTSGELQPGVNWLYSWSLCDDLDLAGSMQFNRAKDEAGHAYTEWAQSMALGLSLSESRGAYAEFYSLYPTSALTGVSPEHYFNSGLTWLPSKDIQWDVRVGMGLTDDSDDFFFGTGVSIRLR